MFRFKAKVTDPNLAPTKVRFEAVSNSNKQMSDAVEITIPVQPPTIVRKESVAASFNRPQVGIRYSPRMPEAWRRGRGHFTTTISTSPWLPQMSGLPVILEYPHGCFEQISTKLLGYSLLANVLAYLPDFSNAMPNIAPHRARHETSADSIQTDACSPTRPAQLRQRFCHVPGTLVRQQIGGCRS